MILLAFWIAYARAVDEWAYDLGHLAIDNHHRELFAYFEGLAP